MEWQVGRNNIRRQRSQARPELARFGFFQSGCHAALIGQPDLHISAPRDIAVETVTSAEQMEEFLAAYIVGWAFRKPRTTNSRGMSDPGSINPAGRFISLGPKVRPLRPQLCLSAEVLAISRTLQPTQHSAIADSTQRWCGTARRRRVRQVLISFVAERIFSRRAIAIWSALVCGSCSCD